MGPSYEPGQVVYARTTHRALEAGARVTIVYVFFSKASQTASYIVQDAQQRFHRLPEEALAPTPTA